MATCSRSAYEAQQYGVTSPLHWRVAGINIAYMAAGTAVYFGIAVLIDYTLSSSWYRSVVFRFGRLPVPVSTRAEDDDVCAERERVLHSAAAGEALSGDAVSIRVCFAIMTELGIRFAGVDRCAFQAVAKQYSTGKQAVRGVTFGIPAGQCFGFLGINGSIL